MTIFQKLPLPIDIINHYSEYLDGHWATEWMTSLTWREILVLYINKIISYIYVFVFLLSYNKSNKHLAPIVDILIFLVLFTLPFTTINGRFMGILVLSIKIFYFMVFENKMLFTTSMRYLFILSLCSILMGIWGTRRQWSVSRINYLLYKPSIAIMCNSYNLKWIESNVDENGGFLNLNN
jgi:hypothetical protein